MKPRARAMAAVLAVLPVRFGGFGWLLSGFRRDGPPRRAIALGGFVATALSLIGLTRIPAGASHADDGPSHYERLCGFR